RRNGHASFSRCTSPADFPFKAGCELAIRPWPPPKAPVLPLIPVIAIISIVVYLETKCPPAGASTANNPDNAQSYVLRNWPSPSRSAAPPMDFLNAMNRIGTQPNSAHQP